MFTAVEYFYHKRAYLFGHEESITLTRLSIQRPRAKVLSRCHSGEKWQACDPNGKNKYTKEGDILPNLGLIKGYVLKPEKTHCVVLMLSLQVAAIAAMTEEFVHNTASDLSFGC